MSAYRTFTFLSSRYFVAIFYSCVLFDYSTALGVVMVTLSHHIEIHKGDWLAGVLFAAVVSLVEAFTRLNDNIVLPVVSMIVVIVTEYLLL